MKRILIYIVILGALVAAPVQPTDVGKLEPVQVVSIYKKNDRIIIETDTQDWGAGKTVQEAWQNLKDTSGGIIYLDTAKYLLLTKETEDAVVQLRQKLKRSVRLCMSEGAVDLQEAAKYLGVHGELPKLKDWEKDWKLPILSVLDDGRIFFKKVEKSS